MLSNPDAELAVMSTGVLFAPFNMLAFYFTECAEGCLRKNRPTFLDLKQPGTSVAVACDQHFVALAQGTAPAMRGIYQRHGDANFYAWLLSRPDGTRIIRRVVAFLAASMCRRFGHFERYPSKLGHSCR